VPSKPKARKLSVVSVFSGCGGLDYGAKLAGCEIVFANDISADSVRSLVRLLGKTDTYVGPCSDITALPSADIVCGGYPCQSFSMGGKRIPRKDERSYLYRDFIDVIHRVDPRYFVAENVPGLIALDEGRHFRRQLRELRRAGRGYRVTWAKLNAADFGVPQNRVRVVIVGVRTDLEQEFDFPSPTHGNAVDLVPFSSHGLAISLIDDSKEDAHYFRTASIEDNFPWYYMSRNRRASALGPSFTVVANWRHTTLHPASPIMKMSWSNLADGSKQRWDFSKKYEVGLETLGLTPLPTPRRLSWRECSAIQTFPLHFEPVGSVQSKFQQIGNAVPPLLAKAIFDGLVSGSALIPARRRRRVINAC